MSDDMPACATCGVEPERCDRRHWTGQRHVTLSWRLMHHCRRGKATLLIEMEAPSEGDLREAWHAFAVTAQATGATP